MNLTFIDWTIMLVYFVFVLGIGFVLRRSIKSSTDFFLSGRSLAAWVTGLAFISANLGAQEVIGMGASGAEYGIATSHFYWIGAIPAMVFVGIFMMPFYYGSRARSVPEYLKLRFDEKTRGFNALTFALMTVLSSGISMYAMAKIIQKWHVLDGVFGQFNIPPAHIFDASVIITGVIVLVYILLGGLTSAIYNEVLQFFLIVAGFLPLVFLGMKSIGWWKGLKQSVPTQSFVHSWQGTSSPETSPMGVEWFGIAMGLGFVLSFGYWCTDFLVIQRAMAADSMSAARRTPLIAAVPKMFFPFLVILPGIIAISLPTPNAAGNAQPGANGAVEGNQQTLVGRGLVPVKVDETTNEPVRNKDGQVQLDYDMAIPNMLLHFFPTGLLGIGLTALLASFMSGMAGNVTAFNTVWTYDIYHAYIYRKGSDRHYLWMGRIATVFGVALSVAAAYEARQFTNIMNNLQFIFGFVNAPLLATFLLGMFWKRATGHGAFVGLICGTLAAAIHHGLTLPVGETAGIHGGWLADLLHVSVVHTYPKEMAQNFWTAIYAFVTCFAVTIGVSLATQPRADQELVGLVYSLTEKPKDNAKSWWARPATIGIIVLAVAVALNFVFW
jgi:solute:Na+ symporter, SSS family